MKSILLRVGRIVGSRRGALTVEAAMLLPVIVFMLAMTLEISRLSVAYTLIEHGAFVGAENAKLARGAGADQLIRQALSEKTFGVFSIDDLDIKLTSSPTMEGILNSASSGGGSAGEYVHLTISANIGLLKNLLPGEVPFSGSREFNLFWQNEPDR